MSKRALKKPTRRKRGLVEAVVTQFRLARYLTLFTVAYLILVGGLFFTLWVEDQNEERDEWRACIQGNTAREHIRNAIAPIPDVIVEQAQILVAAANSTPRLDETPAESDRRRAQTVQYLNNTKRSVAPITEAIEKLTPRSCGPRP